MFHPSTSIFASVVLKCGACHKMLFFPEILKLSSRVLFQAASTELQGLGEAREKNKPCGGVCDVQPHLASPEAERAAG